jgi:hypothetical protein
MGGFGLVWFGKQVPLSANARSTQRCWILGAKAPN